MPSFTAPTAWQATTSGSRSSQNRIEIVSPGRFPGLPSLARPSQITRFARNPRISRICADLRIGQELGEGIKRIFDEMKFGGLAEPIYKQSSSSVRLILPGEPAKRGY